MRIPSVEIQFGGKTRNLIFDYNAKAELQDRAGAYQSNVASLKILRDMLWAGMLAETLDKRGRDTKDTLSVIEVGEILQDMEKPELDELVEAVTKARDIAEPVITDPPKAATPNP